MDTFSDFDAIALNEDGIDVTNTSFRLQLVLVIDSSSSMSSSRQINEVNDALVEIESFFNSNEIDTAALFATEIAVVSFGGDVAIHDLRKGGTAELADADSWAFVEAREFKAPKLVASGATPMGQAMREAIKISDARNRALSKAGMTQRKKPLIWLISDGGANDLGWEGAAQEALAWQDKGLGSVRCLATGSDSDVASARASLEKFTRADVPRLKGARWKDFLEFVTRRATEQATELQSGGGGTTPAAAAPKVDFFDW